MAAYYYTIFTGRTIPEYHRRRADIAARCDQKRDYGFFEIRGFAIARKLYFPRIRLNTGEIASSHI